MLSLYEILKASKTGIAPDMWTALAGKNWGGADSGHEVKELTGIPPLSFTADGTPLLDYLISGNTVQNGTPTPDNPVEVQGVGARTINIVDWNTWISSIVSINGSGSYTTTATSISITSGASTDAYTSPYVASNPVTYRLKVKPNTKYSVSIDGSGSYQLILWKNGIAGSGYGWYFNPGRKFATITTDSETTFYTFRAANTGSLGSTATLSNVMIVEGEYTTQTMPAYEPYGYKIPISSGGVTTNIYLGSTQATRQIKQLVLTGQENWVLSSYANAFYTADYTDYLRELDTNLSLCSHYRTIGQVLGASFISDGVMSWYGKTNASRLYIGDVSFSTAAELQAYLQQQYATGTPVTVWYVLETPETATVNEPLMKIGTYADTLSMEQAGVQIPTLHGNTVIDVETTLKPSEMYIKYQK